jgi:EmrB/QacA subfamily drug resistance transporter
VLPLTLTLLASVTPPERRSLALGLWGGMSGLAVGLGPLIGGWVIEYSSWQWIFWINVPIGIVLLPILALVRESRGGAGRLDPIGVVLVTTGLFGIVFGLVRGEGHGWTSGAVLGSLIVGAALVVGFVVWQAKAPTPMVPLALFRERGFTVVNAVSLVMSFGMFGSIFLGAQYLQVVQGYSPLEAGVRSLPWTAVPAVSAPIAGLLSNRIGSRQIVAVAMALQAVGIGWLAVVTRTSTEYHELVIPFVLSGLGMGLYFTPMARLALGYVPSRFEGVASGTSNALRQLGTVLGIAVLGSVFSAYGGYATRETFVAGAQAGMRVGAVILAAGAVLILLAPRAGRQVAPTEEPLALEPAGV